MGKHSGNQGGRHSGATDRVRAELASGSKTLTQICEATGLSRGGAEQVLLRLRYRGEALCSSGGTRSVPAVWSVVENCGGMALVECWPMPVRLPKGGRARRVSAE